MKKILLITAVIATCTVVRSQNEDDALRFSMDRFSGTARSLSLSGAMGALGGDFSSIAINPAGLAVYRSSEFTFTPALQYHKSDADYYGIKSTDDKFSIPLLQIGFVGTYTPLREVTSGIISSHFSVGYNRTNSFSRRYYMEGYNIKNSLLDRFTFNANANGLDNFYSGVLYGTGLLYDYDDYPGEYYNAFEYIGYDPNGDGYIGFGPNNGVNQIRAIDESGNAGEFHIGGAINVSNKVLLGATFGVNSFNYNRDMQHYEEVSGNNYGDWYPWQYYEHNIGAEGLDNYTFEEKISTVGVGINLKVGVIYKPINSLRVGASFHTPIFYSMNEEFETFAIGNFFKVSLNDEKNEYILGPNVEAKSNKWGDFSYNFRTPFKATGSLAYIFGNRGLISVDYEYTDYSSMSFVSKGSNISDKSYFKDLNNIISNTFINTHNVRVGAEIRPTDLFTLRGGYGYYQSPYKKLFLNSDNKHQTFSGGFGYRMNNMFIDFAYMLRKEKFIYSPFNLDDVDYILPEDKAQSADITSNNHLVAITLGWRF